MPLIPFTLAWLFGIWLASRLALPTIALGVATLVAAVGITLARRAPKPRWMFVLALAAMLGALRYNLAQPRFDQTTLATYNDQPKSVIVEGVVTAEPDARDAYTNLRVEADRLAITDQPTKTVKGLVLVQAPPFTDFRYGDRVRAEGKLQTPTDTSDFSYRDYLARQGVYSIMSRPRVTMLVRDQGFAPLAWLFAFKARTKNVIARILPEPQASLLTGILLGDDSGIPKSVQDAFRATGTSHIIAISGYNVTILVGLMSLAAVRLFGKRRAFYVLAVGLLIYMVLVGASASVVRAVIMGIAFLLAAQVGRQGLALNTLFLTGLAMMVYDPMWLWDAGFQLSFVATLGLILYATPLQKTVEAWLSRVLPTERVKPVMDVLSDALLVTLAAQITTIPLLAYYFKQFSFVSLLTNALVLPAQPGLMVTGGLALLVGFISIPLGQTVGWVAWLFLAWTTGIIELTARIPGAAVPLGDMSIGWIVGYYALLAVVTWWLKQPAEERPSPRQILAWITARLTRRNVLVAAGIVVVLVAVALVQLPDGKLHVYFLDVGQGDAIFVVTPQGRQILIDGGPAPSVILNQLARHTPFWDRSLDVLVATQPDADHLAGLVAVMERYTVGAVLTAEWPGRARDPTVSRWSQLVAERHPSRIQPQIGLKLQIEPGVEMVLLHPEADAVASLSSNDASLVTRLTFGGISFLFTGDVEAEGEGMLMRSGYLRPTTVLKAAHHGAKTSTSPEFLTLADPQFVVISVGAGNPFGHPSPEVLTRLADRRARSVRTDQSGTVEIASDGTRLWIKTER
jgi:competence protein ComEC